MINAQVDLGNFNVVEKQLEKLSKLLDDKEIINECGNYAYDTLMDFTTNEQLMRDTAYLGNPNGWREANELDQQGNKIEKDVNDNLGYYHWSDGQHTGSYNKKQILSKDEAKIYNDLDYIELIEYGSPIGYDYELDETTYNRYRQRGYPESSPNKNGMHDGHTEGYEGLGIFYRTELTLEDTLDNKVKEQVDKKIESIFKE